MEISSLPSLSDLLNQNPNLQPNAQADRFSSNFENLQNPQVQGTRSPNGVVPVEIDKFEQFIKGVDRKKKISARETQDLILGRSDNIHEAVVKSQEAGVAFNLMIEVRNKLVESYKELMRMQV
jgi:flagellar hook-basal body complex protein FliE